MENIKYKIKLTLHNMEDDSVKEAELEKVVDTDRTKMVVNIIKDINTVLTNLFVNKEEFKKQTDVELSDIDYVDISISTVGKNSICLYKGGRVLDREKDLWIDTNDILSKYVELRINTTSAYYKNLQKLANNISNKK